MSPFKKLANYVYNFFKHYKFLFFAVSVLSILSLLLSCYLFNDLVLICFFPCRKVENLNVLCLIASLNITVFIYLYISINVLFTFLNPRSQNIILLFIQILCIIFCLFLGFTIFTNYIPYVSISRCSFLSGNNLSFVISLLISILFCLYKGFSQTVIGMCAPIAILLKELLFIVSFKCTRLLFFEKSFYSLFGFQFFHIYTIEEKIQYSLLYLEQHGILDLPTNLSEVLSARVDTIFTLKIFLNEHYLSIDKEIKPFGFMLAELINNNPRTFTMITFLVLTGLFFTLKPLLTPYTEKESETVAYALIRENPQSNFIPENFNVHDFYHDGPRRLAKLAEFTARFNILWYEYHSPRVLSECFLRFQEYRSSLSYLLSTPALWHELTDSEKFTLRQEFQVYKLFCRNYEFEEESKKFYEVQSMFDLEILNISFWEIENLNVYFL